MYDDEERKKKQPTINEINMHQNTKVNLYKINETHMLTSKQKEEAFVCR